jgi:hypothetical protein
MTVKSFGAIAFPKIPTPAEERLVLEARISQKEAEKDAYAAIVGLRGLSQWAAIQAELLRWMDRLVVRLVQSEDAEVYRCQGEYRALHRFLTITQKPAESCKTLDNEIAAMRQRVGDLRQS